MRKYKSLVLGLEHFIDKIGYRDEAFRHYYHPVKYLVSDNSGFSLPFAEKYNADISIVPKNKLMRLIFIIRYIIKKEFTHAEFYYSGYMVFLYVLACKIMRKKTLSFLIGAEFIAERNILWFLFLKKSLWACDGIIAKQKNLYEEAGKLGLTEKMLLLPNAIKAYSGKILNYEDRDIDILFLNTPRKDRNLFLLIDALRIAITENKNLKLCIVGFSVLSRIANKLEPEYQNSILEYIEQKKMNENIIIKPFVNNPYDYHIRSKIFVLPADCIFLNYSMLESMSCGTVPVVTKGDGWELIINRENGFVSEFDSKQFSNQIQNALIKENWMKKSNKARETVINNYDIKNWGRKILVFKGILDENVNMQKV